jgi:acetyl esterase/lipase
MKGANIMNLIRKTIITAVLLLAPAVHPDIAQGAKKGYTKVRDVSYRTELFESDYARSQCKLDFYLPKGVTDYATIVWFHGGGLKEGSRHSGITVAKRFTSEGLAVVLVSYRFSPKVKCPVYIEDAAAAVGWVFKTIGKYGGDRDKIFISGHSAGGYLAAIIGMDKSYLAKHNVSLKKIAGLMPVSGQMITHSTIREERNVPRGTIIVDRFAPIYHAGKASLPCLCICGDDDLPLRCEENIFFVGALKAAGNKNARYFEVKGRNHSTIVEELHDEDDGVARAMLNFIRITLTKKRK